MCGVGPGVLCSPPRVSTHLREVCTLVGGGVSERPKERASKARVGATSPWVQIPPPPPLQIGAPLGVCRSAILCRAGFGRSDRRSRRLPPPPPLQIGAPLGVCRSAILCRAGFPAENDG